MHQLFSVGINISVILLWDCIKSQENESRKIESTLIVYKYIIRPLAPAKSIEDKVCAIEDADGNI
jgi:hypothetical protein